MYPERGRVIIWFLNYRPSARPAGPAKGIYDKLLQDVVRNIGKPLRDHFGKFPDVQHHAAPAAEVLEEFA